jgi:hypothetical protein
MGGVNQSNPNKQTLSFGSSPASFEAQGKYDIKSSQPELVAKGIQQGVTSAGNSIVGAMGAKYAGSAETKTPETETTSTPDFSQPVAEVEPVINKYSSKKPSMWDYEEMLKYLNLKQK